MSPLQRPAATVAHFAINADNLERAQRFYGKVFGWRFEPWGPPGFFMIDFGRGTEAEVRGSLQQRRELIPGQRMTGFECTISVPDVDAALALVTANGGAIILPKTILPAVGQLFFFRDPEGNVAGVMQYDQTITADE